MPASTQKESIAALEHLMALDISAAEGYRLVAEHVDRQDYRERLEAFKADHDRHTRELEPLIRELGGTPPPIDAKPLLELGMVEIPAEGSDYALLLALKNNEDGTGQTYRRALNQVPEQARNVVARGCSDEERHVQWLGAVLSDMDASASYQGSQRPVGQDRRPPAGR